MSNETAANEKSPGRLIFLGVAYDEAPGKGLDLNDFNYAPDNFTRLLKLQTQDLFVEFKHDSLKGTQATYSHVLAGLRNTRKMLRRDDLVVFYWGTHGGTGRKGWGANLADSRTIHGSEIKAELAGFPCPALMLVSTCGSGGFARERFDGVPVPPNVLVICACQGKRSTSNELDRATLEALAGFGDDNEDRQVTLREVKEYVYKRYLRWFPHDESSDEYELAPVIVAGDSVPLDRPVTQVTGTHVAVVEDGAWYGAQVLEETPKGRKVRFLGADSQQPKSGYYQPDKVPGDEFIDLPGGFPPVEVEWNGEWYPAHVLSQTGNQFRIHYVGYEKEYDETVLRRRVRFPFCKPIGAGRPSGSGKPKTK